MINYQSLATNRQSNKRGFALLEVMLAVAILSIALLALAALQGRMMKNSSDTRTRAIATTIAQNQMDDFRSLEIVRRKVDTPAGVRSFDDIVDGSLGDDSVYGGTAADAVTVKSENSGVAFSDISWDITDYWWDDTTSDFVTSDPSISGTSVSNYKLVKVSVKWLDENGDENTVSLEDIISQASPEDSALLVQERGTAIDPVVGYVPQPAPEVIRVATLGLGGGRFKETSKPLPDVLRNDFSTITTFSTVTFDEDSSGNFATVRREEFFVINCQCQYDSSSSNEGREPTKWNGKEFVLGAEVSNKPTGAVSGTITGQPALCTQCCRDHHDSTGATSLFDPFRPDTDYDDSVTGDHNHYFPDDAGDLVTALAADGDEYLEACRFVRLDGRLRLTHDFNLSAFSILPASQLQRAAGLSGYQKYVIDFVDEYIDAIVDLGSSYPLTLPDTSAFSAAATLTEGNSADIDTVGFNRLPETMLARGVYVDYLDPDLLLCIRTRRGDVAAVDAGNNITPDECRPEAAALNADGTVDANGGFLDITPFYEVNVSRLANWSRVGDVDVYDEPLSQVGVDDICYSPRGDSANGVEVACRGFTAQNGAGASPARVTASMEDSNSGLTDTRPIDLDEALTDADGFFVKSKVANLVVVTGVANDAIIIQGNINLAGQVSSVSASDMRIDAFGTYTDENGNPASVECTKPTGSSYRCAIPVPADRPNADSFPLATVFGNLQLGIRVARYGDNFQSGNNIVYEDNRVCAAGIPFNQRITGAGDLGEATFLEFLLADLTYEAFDSSIVSQNVFSLDLLVRPQTGGGPCDQRPEGTISVMTL